MAVTAFLYGLGAKHLMAGNVDLENDDIYVALLDSGYTPDQDADEYWDDISANEVSGTGYTAGGQILANPTLTYTGATNIANFDADNVSWASSTITARFAVWYKNTGTPGTSILLGWVNFGADVSTTAATFQITWDAAGIAKVTVS